MKKAIFAVFAAVMAVAFSVSAHAADPDLVVNSTGTQVFGLGPVYGVAPASQSLSNTTTVLFAGSTGWQNVEDPYGSKYTTIKDRLVAVGAIEVGTGTGVYYVPNRAMWTGCDSQGSYLQLPNTGGQTRSFISGDGCAYRDKVRPHAK